MLMVIF